MMHEGRWSATDGARPTWSKVRKCSLVAGLVAVTMLSACGSSDDGSSGTASSGSSTKPVRIAYLSFAVANSFDAPMLAAAQTVAKEHRAKITVFDANNDPNKQLSQLQDVVSQGGFDAIVVQPIFGTGLIDAVNSAIAKGIKVVNLDQILGVDFSTAKAQVPGLSGNVVQVPGDQGAKVAKLIADECKAVQGPCSVGYIADLKTSSKEGAYRKAFDAQLKGTNVKIVAEGESHYTIDGGLKAAQDMLASHPDIHVLTGADQAMQGAEQALKHNKKVRLVSHGGSAAGLRAVAEGRWVGDVVNMPATEGREAILAAIRAVRDGKASRGSTPIATLPAGGVATKANVGQFTAEWPG
jgi:ribose transport system substrate-binding protein